MTHDTVPLWSLTVGGVIDIQSHCCAPIHYSVLSKATLPTTNDRARHRQEAMLVLGWRGLLGWPTLAQGLSIDFLKKCLVFLDFSYPAFLPSQSFPGSPASWPLQKPSQSPQICFSLRSLKNLIPSHCLLHEGPKQTQLPEGLSEIIQVKHVVGAWRCMLALRLLRMTTICQRVRALARCCINAD